MPRRYRVLLTGADGVIGNVLRQPLAELYDVSCLTQTPTKFPSHVGDVRQLESIEAAFTGCDAVIHLAGESTVDAGWESVLDANLVGTYNVFTAAHRAGVGKVIYASSIHVVGMYEADAAPGVYDLSDTRVVDESVPVRPDSLYGVSKVFGEALGRLYSDRYGIDVICLRLGAVGAMNAPPTAVAGRPFAAWPELAADEAGARLRAAWLSHRDCLQLFLRALECTAHWAVVYGTSDNPRQLWDLTGAREILGYRPEDSAPL